MGIIKNKISKLYFSIIVLGKFLLSYFLKVSEQDKTENGNSEKTAEFTPSTHCPETVLHASHKWAPSSQLQGLDPVAPSCWWRNWNKAKSCKNPGHMWAEPLSVHFQHTDFHRCGNLVGTLLGLVYMECPAMLLTITISRVNQQVLLKFIARFTDCRLTSNCKF